MVGSTSIDALRPYALQGCGCLVVVTVLAVIAVGVAIGMVL